MNTDANMRKSPKAPLRKDLSEPVQMTLKDWLAEGKRRFGSDALLWRFVCPVCGHVQKPLDFKQYVRLGATESSAYSECIGRYIPGSRDAFSKTGAGPCNYAGYGLFRLGPIKVFDENTGTKQLVFAFDEATEKATA